MASNTVNIHKLQTALNMKGCKILYSTSQFYSEKADRPVTMYTVKRAIWDEVRGRNTSEKLFESTSQIQIVLFLKDLWDEINGKEVDTSNEIWQEKKKQYIEKENRKNARKESRKKDNNKQE